MLMYMYRFTSQSIIYYDSYIAVILGELPYFGVSSHKKLYH